ncbi:MAG: hypothetical protein RI911_419 [Candidatus Parcubacteria bacterium]
MSALAAMTALAVGIIAIPNVQAGEMSNCAQMTVAAATINDINVQATTSLDAFGEDEGAILVQAIDTPVINTETLATATGQDLIGETTTSTADNVGLLQFADFVPQDAGGLLDIHAQAAVQEFAATGDETGTDLLTF